MTYTFASEVHSQHALYDGDPQGRSTYVLSGVRCLDTFGRIQADKDAHLEEMHYSMEQLCFVVFNDPQELAAGTFTPMPSHDKRCYLVNVTLYCTAARNFSVAELEAAADGWFTELRAYHVANAQLAALALPHPCYVFDREVALTGSEDSNTDD